MSDDTGGAPAAYARQVGDRLRVIRRQQGLSLQDVESTSGDEFKASVLGAYERGERVISVPRLQRLAAVYHVPVDQLLPSGGNHEGEAPAARAADASSVTFDLGRFDEVHDPELDMVHHYLDDIAVRRQDFNGRMMTIRADDMRAIAGLFGTDVTELLRRLDEHQLRLQN